MVFWIPTRYKKDGHNYDQHEEACSPYTQNTFDTYLIFSILIGLLTSSRGMVITNVISRELEPVPRFIFSDTDSLKLVSHLLKHRSVGELTIQRHGMHITWRSRCHHHLTVDFTCRTITYSSHSSLTWYRCFYTYDVLNREDHSNCVTSATLDIGSTTKS